MSYYFLICLLCCCRKMAVAIFLSGVIAHRQAYLLLQVLRIINLVRQLRNFHVHAVLDLARFSLQRRERMWGGNIIVALQMWVYQLRCFAFPCFLLYFVYCILCFVYLMCQVAPYYLPEFLGHKISVLYLLLRNKNLKINRKKYY